MNSQLVAHKERDVNQQSVVVGSRESMVNPSVKGVSRKLNEKVVANQRSSRDGTRGKDDLSEHSTDERKPNDVAHLDGKAHSSTSVTLAGV